MASMASAPPSADPTLPNDALASGAVPHIDSSSSSSSCSSSPPFAIAHRIHQRRNTIGSLVPISDDVYPPESPRGPPPEDEVTHSVALLPSVSVSSEAVAHPKARGQFSPPPLAKSPALPPPRLQRAQTLKQIHHRLSLKSAKVIASVYSQRYQYHHQQQTKEASDLEQKTAAYEQMMAHFQLRKLSSSGPPSAGTATATATVSVMRCGSWNGAMVSTERAPVDGVDGCVATLPAWARPTEPLDDHYDCTAQDQLMGKKKNHKHIHDDDEDMDSLASPPLTGRHTNSTHPHPHPHAAEVLPYMSPSTSSACHHRHGDDACGSSLSDRPGATMATTTTATAACKIAPVVVTARPWPLASFKRRMRRLLRKSKRLWRFFRRSLQAPLTPNGLVFKLRWLVLGIVFFVQLVYLPIAPAYFPQGHPTVTKLNLVFEIVFLLDMLLTFNTSYYDSKTLTLVTSRRQIAKRYLRRWFLLDLLSAIPITTIHSLQQQEHTINNNREGNADDLHVIFHLLFRLPRLAHLSLAFGRLVWLGRVLRVGKELLAWLLYSRYSHLMRILRMIVLIVLTSHYIACCWHWITGDSPDAPNAILVDGQAPPRIVDQYIADLYYAVMLIQGQGDPKGGTRAQNLFATFAVLLGSVVLAVVFGNVAMLVAVFNANTTSHQRKMEVVFATMNKLQLPRELRDRIHLYYEYVWQEYESLDGDVVKFSKELTHTLALEVGLYRHMNLILKVPFWKTCSPDFVTQVVLSLVVRVYLPDDYIVREGEVGEEMFMVNHGCCEFMDVEKAGFDRPTLATKDKAAAKPVGTSTTTTASTMASAAVATGGGAESAGVVLSARQPLWRRPSGSMQSSLATSEHEHSSDEDDDDDDEDDGHDDAASNDGHGAAAVYPEGSARAPPVAAASAARHARLRLVRAGQSFGEMALLMNYRRTSAVRAVGHIEMCILDRTKFQAILTRYPDDRRKVLRVILAACVAKNELPIPWSDVCGLIAETRGVSVRRVLDEREKISMEEIVDVLLHHIDRPVVDESIRFGYQCPDSKPTAMDGSALPRYHVPVSLKRKTSGSRSMPNKELLQQVVEVETTTIPTIGGESDICDGSGQTQTQTTQKLNQIAQHQSNNLEARVQTIEQNQAQMLEMLRVITDQLRSMGNSSGHSQSGVYIPATKTSRPLGGGGRMVTTDAATIGITTINTATTTNTAVPRSTVNSSVAPPPPSRPSLHRRVSLGSSLYQSRVRVQSSLGSPESSTSPSVTRLADELWRSQGVGSIH